MGSESEVREWVGEWEETDSRVAPGCSTRSGAWDVGAAGASPLGGARIYFRTATTTTAAPFLSPRSLDGGLGASEVPIYTETFHRSYRTRNLFLGAMPVPQ